MTAKHTSHAKIKKAVRRELALAGTAFFDPSGGSRVEIALKRQSKWRVSCAKNNGEPEFIRLSVIIGR